MQTTAASRSSSSNSDADLESGDHEGGHASPLPRQSRPVTRCLHEAIVTAIGRATHRRDDRTV